MNKEGKVIKNKARLVCKDYAQVEGIDFDETFELVARLETIRMLLALAAYKNFKIFQMDIKVVFLNCVLEEEVYIEYPNGFQLEEDPNAIFKLKKALYRLKQAPRAWYSILYKNIMDWGFKQGIVGSNLYLKHETKYLIIIIIYVNYIIFGSSQVY